MLKLTLEEIVAAAQELPPVQRAELINRLQHPDTGAEHGLTREQAIAELSALRSAGAFDHVESLLGKYADPTIDISAEELQAAIRESATAWEEELDEYFNDEG